MIAVVRDGAVCELKTLPSRGNSCLAGGASGRVPSCSMSYLIGKTNNREAPAGAPYYSNLLLFGLYLPVDMNG